MIGAAVAVLRRAYRATRAALPWLDMAVWPEDAPAFAEFARPHATPWVRRAVLAPELAGRVAALRSSQDVHLLRWDPGRAASVAAAAPLLDEAAAARMPLVVLHTDMAVADIAALALRSPHLPVIVESGPRKLLYHLAELRQLLRDCPNVYLCTYNLCNWLALEELRSAGLHRRLLFGTHTPRYDADAAMGPIVLGRLTWAEQCDIAGNNLRRLLGRAEELPADVGVGLPPAFIVDAHAHNGAPVGGPFGTFPTPDLAFAPADWLVAMDAVGIARLLLTPMAALADPEFPARHGCADLLRAAPARFGYFEVFAPGQSPARRAGLGMALADPACVGLKIHPSFHRTDADDDAYAEAYRLAAAADKPVLTHSWEASSYNPEQYRSHPVRFRRHLAAHPGVRFVLGHAGGRPSSLDAVCELCRDFPRVAVDLSGDYFDNGLIDCLDTRLGADRVLFGSDLNWVDPRCRLGPVLASGLPDAAVAAILHDNAERVYGRGRL